MSKYTTYLKSQDGHLLGSVGAVNDNSVATYLGPTNSGIFPDTLDADGGSPVLYRTATLPATANGTLWVRIPKYCTILTLTLQSSAVTTSGTYAFYLENEAKTTSAPILNGSVPATTAVTTLTPTGLLLATGNNIVLRFDVASVAPTTASMTITFTYVVNPQSDS